MINKTIHIGNLGRDPEVRTTNSGSSVCNFSIACNERRKDRDGNWTDHTEWINVVTFGKTAENVGRFLTKGRQVYVEGRLQTRKWQDRDGNDRWSTEVVAEKVQFLGSKGGDRDSGGGYSDGGRSGGGYGGGHGAGHDDDDLPF